jgi:predicted DsbA family dithiol-disulfide isomerase
MTPSITIDLFSDFVCPWCFIGNVRLQQAIDGLAGEVTAEVSHHPFFLDPTVPPEGVSIPDMLRKKYGADPKQLWARVEGAARDSGLALNLSLQPKMYPTAAAHTLVRHAEAKGTDAALVAALFHSYFQAAANIGDASVLAGIAEQHGFTRDEALELIASDSELELTREAAISAAQGGIRGVPFFVFDGKLAVSGAQPVSVLQAAMRQALAQAGNSEPPLAV